MRTKMVVVAAMAMAAGSAMADYTAPYVDDANTLVLYHMNSTLDDDSANPGRDRDMYTGVDVPAFTSTGGMAGFGECAVFNGTSSRIHIKNSIDLPSDNIRYEFWMKEGTKKNDDSWSRVMLDAWSAGLEIEDRSSSDYRLDFDVWDSAGTHFEVVGTDGGWGFDASDWNHVAMEIEGGTFSVFVNDGLVGSASGPVTPTIRSICTKRWLMAGASSHVSTPFFP